MRTYKREKYNLTSYNGERYRLDIWSNDTKIEFSIYENNIETLYIRAKEEAEKGNDSEIWELKYEFKI